MTMPIILTALVVILVITLRWFSHKERMAMIAQGLSLEEKMQQQRDQENRHKWLLAAGLILGLLGLALTIGLLTLGMGPWLLAGLLPLFVGLALILTSFILRPEKPEDEVEPEPEVEEVVEEVVEVVEEPELIDEDEEKLA